MSTTPCTTPEELQNIGQFESLCDILLSPPYGEYLAKPLGYWVLPTDRRLPLAFLSRSLDDLLHTSYEDLAKTPGVGRKKMTAFMKLLSRAAKTDPKAVPTMGFTTLARSTRSLSTPFLIRDTEEENLSEGDVSDAGFDPANVSELQWSQWRASVMQHDLGEEKLGRFAPSLQNVTKVIWNTPLSVFAQFSLADMRSKRTYGEKRISAVMEVFHGLHNLLAGLGNQPHLQVNIAPRLIDRMERWVGRLLQTPGIPEEEEIRENFISPLLRQIEIDASLQVAALAEYRLGIGGPLCSVRQSARNMGLTRARVYQLLNEINDIAAVRWPLGRHQVYELLRKFDRESMEIDSPPNLAQFAAAVEIIFPDKRRGANGSLDYAEEPMDTETADLIEV